MRIERIQLPSDGSSCWAGMGDFVLISPDGRHEIGLEYVGEPPHGDSFHSALVNGRALPGLVWGCNFAATADSRYLAASWMAQRYERRTIIIDLQQCSFLPVPIYMHDFRFEGFTLEGLSPDGGLRYDIPNTGAWTSL